MMDSCERLTSLTSDDHPKLEYDHLRREFTRQVGVRYQILPEGKSRTQIDVLAEPVGGDYSFPSRRSNWGGHTGCYTSTGS